MSYILETPNIQYTSFTYNTYEIDLNNIVVAATESKPAQYGIKTVSHDILSEANMAHVLSYRSPANSIVVSFTPNIPLAYFEARVTKLTDDFGVGIGSLAAYRNSGADGVAFAGNTAYTININITSSVFPKTNLALDESFRVSLYSKAYSTGVWDAVVLLLDKNGATLQTLDANNSGIEVWDNQPIPLQEGE